MSTNNIDGPIYRSVSTLTNM